MKQNPFPQIVFSGGGLRCFWQGGFMDVVRDPMGLAPKRITGVSGGAMSAAGFIAHRGHDILERMKAAFSETDSNVSLTDLDNADGRSPHQRIFHEVVEEIFDAATQDIVANGPHFQILLGHPPTSRLPGLSGSLMTLFYEAELHLVNAPHFNWAERFGLRSTLVDARAAAERGQLGDLIRAAVTIPPVFRTPEWDGQPVIDGGMADQAPLPEPNTGRTLILLTRQYRRLPATSDRLYLAPSESTPADKIDFTDPDKLTNTWNLGRRDGEDFLNSNHSEEEN